MEFHKYFFVVSSSMLRSVAAGLLLVVAACTEVDAQTLPTNIDFASANFNNWKVWVGISATGTPASGASFTTGVISAPIGGNAPKRGAINRSRHFITSGSDTDYYGGFPIVCPTGGPYSLRIGTDSNNFRAERVQYFIHVPAGTSSYNLQCQFAIVMEDPGHAAEEQPTFQVVAYDSATGAVLPAANNLYISRYVVPGFMTNREPLATRDTFIHYLPWTTSTVNLSGMGGKTVVLECTALACSLSGHWGYGYFDVTSAADSLMASLISYNSTGDSALLQGPPGYMNYRWYNQNFTQALNNASYTARTKSLPLAMTPEYYNLVIVPYDVNGVPDTIRTQILKASSLRVGQLSPEVATVYPSPARTTLHINFAKQFAGSVSLYNSVGSCVYSNELSKNTELDIPVSLLAAGTYTLILKDQEGVAGTMKVEVTR
jgi:hypothetical protein